MRRPKIRYKIAQLSKCAAVRFRRHRKDKLLRQTQHIILDCQFHNPRQIALVERGILPCGEILSPLQSNIRACFGPLRRQKPVEAGLMFGPRPIGYERLIGPAHLLQGLTLPEARAPKRYRRLNRFVHPLKMNKGLRGLPQFSKRNIARKPLKICIGAAVVQPVVYSKLIGHLRIAFAHQLAHKAAPPA